MKFSWGFLKEFLDLGGKIRPQDLGDKLTSAGLEIGHIEKAYGDFSFDAEVTSNRPDLLSILGIAHEAGALLGKKVNLPKLPPAGTLPVLDNVSIEEKEGCSLYIGRAIKGVRVKESPLWLKNRLLACGINPVNNVVDITNYCLLKWGQPLHAFDLSRISGNIAVRRARKGEKLLCLDNKDRLIPEGAPVIADSRAVLALAGIIGGRDSEVNSRTTAVFLEAAVFSPQLIRRARRQMGIDTESSYRFERAVNPVYTEAASLEAARLISMLAGGRVEGYVCKGRVPVSENKKILFSNKRMNAVLGAEIKEKESLSILKNLGCKIKRIGKKVFVVPPVFRRDLFSQEDLSEEVARVWGYKNIRPKLPQINLSLEGKDSFYAFKNRVRDKLSILGFKEIVTFSIVSQSDCFVEDMDKAVRIINPLKSGEDILRPDLFSGMAKVLKFNLYRKREGLAFFEIADRFARKGKIVDESQAVCLGGHSGKEEDFYLFKGKVEKFLELNGISRQEFKSVSHPLFSTFAFIGDLGWIGILNSEKAKVWDLEKAFFSEIDLSSLQKKASSPKFSAINNFPSVERDISLALSKTLEFKEVEKIIEEKAGGLLKEIRAIDVYRGEKLPEGCTGLTLRIVYQHKEKTLSSEEVDLLHGRLRQALAEKEGVLLR